MRLSIPAPYPETKPATEFINGELVQKMSPRGLHAQVEGLFFAALHAWATKYGSGRVGTEWDFDITPPGEQTNRLVPDVAYLSYDRIAYEDDAAADIPTVPPNVVVEVLSPGQTHAELAEKARLFLAAGCELVIVVNPREEEALLHDDKRLQRIAGKQYLTHPALPGFKVRLSSLFEKPKPKKRPSQRC